MLRAGTLPNPLQPQQQQQQEGTEGQAAADGAPPTQPQPRPAAAPPVAPTMEDLHKWVGGSELKYGKAEETGSILIVHVPKCK